MTNARSEKVLFAVAAFLSACLLFSVQPMMGRLLAPLLGGAPSVWNTCLVFFQTILLLGYGYSHFVGTRLSPRAQRWVHTFVLLGAFLALPLGIPEWAAANVPVDAPISWLLKTLLVAVGLPFFALSTQAPLLQLWLGRRGQSPFFLYAASNAGSLIALLAYPIAIESTMRMAAQISAWTIGFGILIPLVWITAKPTADNFPKEAAADEIITWARRLLWLVLAFVPSSLLQAVTSYLTADIASLPLLWVVPLALYLLTFIIAFSERLRIGWLKLDAPMVMGAVALVLLLAMEASQPAWLMMFVHVGFFTLASLYCHQRLADNKPSPARLTEFYLWMSIGGAAGGFFNALIAPQIFSHVAEYPIAIILACLMRPGLWKGPSREKALDISIGIILFVLAAMIALMLRALKGNDSNSWTAPAFALMALLCYFLKNRPLRLAIGLTGILLGASFAGSGRGQVVHIERNFFGVIRVTKRTTTEGQFHQLYHGTTIHGIQRAGGANRCEPLSYYYSGGAFERMWELANNHRPRTNICVVGLGSGATVGYAKPHQRWDLYEIDPAIIDLAQDTNWFTFLQCAKPNAVKFILGDARQQLVKAPTNHYDVMIMDAFSSDAVPMHLLTREAMRMYVEKLAPGGVIIMHISSRNLNLEPVVINVAHAEGLLAHRPAYVRSADDKLMFDALWVLLTRPNETIPALQSPKQWRPLKPDPAAPTWTDDFRNLWSVITLH